jgi:hypothetical protein
MRGLLRPFTLAIAVLLLASACSTASSGSSSSSSSSGSVRCLDRGPSGQGARTASEQPDRPLFFLFCVQSP